ncbi:MAG TPA: sigma-70 family RNA polymerase sigma factor [Gemmataceae bacterium]|jgi:RNA polymerase sigma factor (sigma-70 family)|nr:sigma-70 family RNA polymerase sigma factor [Gemmataceae bacterium]
MAAGPMNEVVQHLRRTVLRQDGAGLNDGQLLECFLQQRDDAAFAALVRRHGPMVWGVCRRLLSHHDAEDAFQATFLVLVRKATSVVPQQKVGNWLHGVAYQTALQARRTAARRREREKQVSELPEPAMLERELCRDLQPLLHQELNRLPDVYREVIVLADLEGKSRREIAEQLGLPEGTVASRLARARTMLAGRLARRGVALAVGTVAAALAPDAASASVPAALESCTIEAAALFATGQAAANGVISANVIALTEGVLKTMFVSKLKIAAAVVLVIASLTGGAGLVYQTQAAQDTSGKEKQAPATQRADGPGSEKGDKTAEMQRRIAELEKQIQTLTSEVMRLKEILNTPTRRADAKPAAKTIQLQNRSADEVCKTLWDLYRNKSNHDVQIAKDGPTNSLILVGNPDDVAVIESIVIQLEKLPKKAQEENRLPK